MSPRLTSNDILWVFILRTEYVVNIIYFLLLVVPSTELEINTPKKKKFCFSDWSSIQSRHMQIQQYLFLSFLK